MPPAGFEPALPPPECNPLWVSGLLPATIVCRKVTECALCALLDSSSRHEPHHARPAVHRLVGRSTSLAALALLPVGLLAYVASPSDFGAQSGQRCAGCGYALHPRGGFNQRDVPPPWPCPGEGANLRKIVLLRRAVPWAQL